MDLATMNGTFKATYELPMLAVEFTRTPVAQALTSMVDALVTLEAADTGLKVALEFRTHEPKRATATADALAAQFARFLTLYFADRLETAMVAKRTEAIFEPDDSTARYLIAEPCNISISGCPVTLITGMSITRAADALSEFDLRRMAPPPAFAADVETAREMFFVGMTIQNPVIRFLTLYSSLALLALFKWGKGGQQNIDRLLLDENPHIPVTLPPSSTARSKPETTYTAARNTLIHAEERRNNPAAAISDIERLTPEFRSLVARILKKG
jgi:hypothetical protein